MFFERFTDRKGEFRWRLRANNGHIIATVGEGYKNEAHRDHMIQQIKAGVVNAEVRDEAPKPPRKPRQKKV